MERAGGQPPQPHESFRSFDTLASIDLLRFDLRATGYVRAETLQRVCDEELTYIAEGINRPLDTDFTLREANGELLLFHKGEWQPYLATLERGLRTAQAEAQVDPRKAFMVVRAAKDLRIGRQFLKLRPGEVLAWESAFPDQECIQYGEQFIGSLGFQAARRMGFLHTAERNPDGSLTLRSRSVDNSDEAAFTAAKVAAAAGGDIEAMRAAYDGTLSRKHGSLFFAGRNIADRQPEENAWQVVTQHKDLLQYYFDKLQALAAEAGLPRGELERAKKRLTYSVWATLKERLDQNVTLHNQHSYGFTIGSAYHYEEAVIQAEANQSYDKLSARGEVLFGCGGAIPGEEALLSASSSDVFDAVFGRKSEWKKMTCPFCGDKQQWGDPCSPNQHCSACKARVLGGKVVSKGNGGPKVQTEKQPAEIPQQMAEPVEQTHTVSQETGQEESQNVQQKGKLALAGAV